MTPYIRSKRISTQHKIRLFKTYIEPVLLYNSETWTLTATLENTLNAFHRRLLRITLNSKYPKVISNHKLYHITKEVPITRKIKKRRLALFGHILRLDSNTPAQKALQYYLTTCTRPQGRPPLTWLAQITKDLNQTIKHHNIETPLTANTLAKLTKIAQNQSSWRTEIARNMGGDL